jgi:hypothetical protein
MRRNYNNWMADSVKELTPAGNIKKPSYETVVNWVNDSWNAVDVNLIQRSFKCCGISNKRDGTEDELIFDYDLFNQSGQLDNEVEIDNENQRVDIEDDYYDGQSTNYNNVWND